MKARPIKLSQIQGLLHKVRRPARYIGGEVNSVRKCLDKAVVTVALVYPDVYEIAMSNLGIQILYERANELDYAAVERAFLPWPDMASELRSSGIPLFTLESRAPLRAFDLVAFSICHELVFTNVLEVLDLSQIPLKSSERQKDDDLPIVIAGGLSTFNPEPLAEFIDLFFIGEGEEGIVEILEQLRDAKVLGLPRREKISRLCEVDGVYNPRDFEPLYDENGNLAGIVTQRGKSRVRKRVLVDIDSCMAPLRPIVPIIAPVHDRLNVEIMRGCSRGCRFCMAGYLYRPVRERGLEAVEEMTREGERATGQCETSFVSLSSSDYSAIEELIRRHFSVYGERWRSVSLPSLRSDSFSVELSNLVSRNRRPTLTFAPEAGTERLRAVINKPIKDDELLECMRLALRAGFLKFKLYFMLGLPTEREEDVKAIASVAERIVDLARSELSGERLNRWFRLTISVALFSPKPHTPFQWIGQLHPERFNERLRLLAGLIKSRHVELKWHDPYMTTLESALARGDRRLGPVLERAWRNRCVLDGWEENFSYEKWRQAFADQGLDLVEYATRSIPIDQVLPWEHIDSGLSKEFLVEELRKAFAGRLTEDCRTSECYKCGVCQSLKVKNIFVADSRAASA